MRSIFYALSGILLLLLVMFSCSKEKSFESNASKGSLQSDISGDCLPSTINGLYQADSALVDTVNYIDVQAEITTPGAYSISSDTIDGFYFKGEGDINTTGVVTIRLAGHGIPSAAGTFTLNVTYGTTSCAKEITVTDAGGGATTSEYSIEDLDGNCPTPTFAGTYNAGIPLDASNTLTFDVNVTKAGTYAFTVPTDDGITFTGSGSFIATGKQPVILQASGTPQTEGDVSVSIETCDFDLTVMPNNLPDAVLTLNCGSAQISGTYMAGVATTSQNTVTITATVTQAGKYNFSTSSVNGVTFSGTGAFATSSTTPQNIVLTASGTPAAEGSNTFSLSGNGATCSFVVPFSAAPTPAVFTLAGAPNACTNATVNGIYTSGVAADGSNSISIMVNVTATGPYSIATDTQDGISFSASGSFSSTGMQAVTLAATGTPIASGTFNFTPQVGSSSCSFTITVADAQVSDGIYTCKIDGVYTTFNDRSQAKIEDDIFTNNQQQLYLDGYTAPANGNSVPEFQIFINKTDGSTVTTGTYDEKHYIPPGTYRIEIDYHVVNADNSVTIWNTSSNFLSTNPPFTIIVTSLTSTRVKGTFSGKLTNTFEGSTGTKTITEGTFDLPIVP